MLAKWQAFTIPLKKIMQTSVTIKGLIGVLKERQTTKHDWRGERDEGDEVSIQRSKIMQYVNMTLIHVEEPESDLR